VVGDIPNEILVDRQKVERPSKTGGTVRAIARGAALVCWTTPHFHYRRRHRVESSMTLDTSEQRRAPRHRKPPRLPHDRFVQSFEASGVDYSNELQENVGPDSTRRQR
jgi:hypothetical protein